MAGKLTIRWSNDLQLSAVHAAHVVATGARCIDRKTEQLLVAPVTEINSRLLSASIDVANFWQRLMEETLADPNNKHVCEIALTVAGCSELQVEQISRVIMNRLSEARSAFSHRFPKLNKQLELRGRPIRERWETIGPGLLANIAKQIWVDSPPKDWWPSRVDVALVQPMLGGDGDFDSNESKFWIEAVLTDPDPAVPEVLRVAWLATQLAIEIYTREHSSERVPGDEQSPMPWATGIVPLVLSAGVELDLIRPSHPLPISTALSLWRLGDDSLAEIVSDWWNDWQSAPTPMPVALKELGKMIQPTRQSRVVDDSIDISDFDD